MHDLFDIFINYHYIILIHFLQISYFFLTVLGIELKTFIINEISSMIK